MKKASPSPEQGSAATLKKPGIKPIWCPGCGDYSVFNALVKVLQELEIPPEEIGMVSGIGCSGRFSHYFNAYSLHGTHGRALPTATGLKAARPDLKVFAVGGDGDGLSIGGGHIAHAARKNVDITYLLIDNNIYGLTKGQTSPTTDPAFRTKTAPYGHQYEPLTPLPMFLAYDASFTARVHVLNQNQLRSVIKAAIEHRGFSIVQIMSPCVTYQAMPWEVLKEGWEELPDDHPLDDKMKAMEKAYCEAPRYSGIFYQVDKPSLDDRLEEIKRIALKSQEREDGEYLGIRDIITQFH
jgi:2-oxoglutarate ferredoxin oxidoreductase subunit beta